MLIRFPKEKNLLPYQAKRRISDAIPEGTIGYVERDIPPTRVYVQAAYSSSMCITIELGPEQFEADWEPFLKPRDLERNEGKP